MIRFFDILLSLLGLLLLSPVFLLVSIAILAGGGRVFFIQPRVGRNNADFRMIKFRTMAEGSDRSGLLTVGTDDRRITRTGRILRKYKLDELPQLINVLAGTMSMVGPRPEVRKYVEMCTPAQREVLTVRPGITDLASIEYFRENELLSRSEDPEGTYIREIMPAKILLNMEFVRDPRPGTYFRILAKTLARIFR